MNLDKQGPPERPELLAPPEWSMDLIREGTLYTVIVKRAFEPMCRLSIATTVGDEQAARTALAHKARLWIHEYLDRPPGNDTSPDPR